MASVAIKRGDELCSKTLAGWGGLCGNESMPFRPVNGELGVAESPDSPALWMPMKVPIKTGHPGSVASVDLCEIVDSELAGDPDFWPKSAA